MATLVKNEDSGPPPGPEQYLAVVFRCQEDFLFKEEGVHGLVPFTHKLMGGLPFPTTVGYDTFMAWVDRILESMGINPAGSGISIHVRPEGLTLRPMQNIQFTLAIIDIPEQHFERVRQEFSAPLISASDILQNVNSNLFFGMIASEYRVPMIAA